MGTDEHHLAAVSRLRDYIHLYATSYPDVWRLHDEVRAKQRSLWPVWCFAPMEITVKYVDACGRKDEGRGYSGILAALAAWRVTQGIYCFDPTVADALMAQDFDGEVPGEVLLRLPEWGVYVLLPKVTCMPDGTDQRELFGFFAHLDYERKNGRRLLRIVADIRDGSQPRLMQSLPILLEGTLNNSVKIALEDEAREDRLNVTFTEEDHAQFQEQCGKSVLTALRPFLNFCLYLCADNAEIPGERKRPVTVKTKRGPRLFSPDAPTFWEVAYRTGAAIRQAQSEEAVKYAAKGGSHAAPRPHLRKAHWHHFWTGPRANPAKIQPTERKLIHKWLPPIPVNVDAEHPVVPVIHEVLPKGTPCN